MPNYSELLTEYNRLSEEERKQLMGAVGLKARSLLTDYGKLSNIERRGLITEFQSREKVSPISPISPMESTQFRAEFAPTEPTTTAVRPKAPIQMGVVPSKIEELPERAVVESKAKDIRDALYLGGIHLWHQSKQFFKSTLPNTQLKEIKPGKLTALSPYITEEQAKKFNITRIQRLKEFKEKYDKANKIYAKYLIAHPELKPRKEWSKGVIETIKNDPTILIDPVRLIPYVGYVAAQSAAFTAGVMGVTLGVTALTKNPILGMAAGMAMATPMQVQDLTDELVANGMKLPDAAQLAFPIGTIIASVEVLGDLPILTAVSKPFASMLHIGITKEVGKQVAKKTAKTIAKRGLKTFLAAEGGEIIEEIVQHSIQSGVVKTVAQNKGILQTVYETVKDYPEIIAQTAMATIPFAGIAGAAQMRTGMREQILRGIPPEKEIITKPTEKPIVIKGAELATLANKAKTPSEFIKSVGKEGYRETSVWVKEQGFKGLTDYYTEQKKAVKIPKEYRKVEKERPITQLEQELKDSIKRRMETTKKIELYKRQDKPIKRLREVLDYLNESIRGIKTELESVRKAKVELKPPKISTGELLSERSLVENKIRQWKKIGKETMKLEARLDYINKNIESIEKETEKDYKKELMDIDKKLRGVDFKAEDFEKREKLSNSRKRLIHILGWKKGLIYRSERTGKVERGRFNKILKNYSEDAVISVKKLRNNADADHIIEIINMFPDWREGQKRPVIPVKKLGVTKEWNEGWKNALKGIRGIPKEPTIFTWLTPQWYTALKLGLSKIIRPIWEGKLSVQHFHAEATKEFRRMGKRINRLYRAPATEIARAVIKRVPTRAYQRMANLLDTYEEVKEGWSEEEKNIFNYFRDKTREYIKQENAIRKQLGLKPIKYRKAYLRHVATEIGHEMLSGRYPFPETIKYYMKDRIGKKPYNPTEFNRLLGKLSDDIYGLFSKDPIYAMESLAWHALKEIHLAVPLNYARENLNVLGDRISARSRKWFERYVNETVKGQIPDIDAGINNLLKVSGVEGFINFFMRKFGRTLGYNPIRKINSKFTRAVHIGLIAGVARLVVRNLFQFVQDIAVYPIRSVVQAYIGLAPKEVKQWAKESMFLKTYSGFELIPKGAWSGLIRLGMIPYQASALFNARKGYLVAGTAAYRLYKSPKWRKLGWTLERVKEEAEYGAKLTQYWYHLMGMPQIFRLKSISPFTVLQSWWMNYIFGLQREIFTRLFIGKTYDAVPIPLSWRVGMLRYMALGVPFLVWMGYKRSTILGVLPSNMAPMAEFAFGFYMYMNGAMMGGDRGEWMKKKGKRKMLYSYKAFIPYSNAWRNFMKQWDGAPWREFFLYPKKKPKPKKPTKLTPMEIDRLLGK